MKRIVIVTGNSLCHNPRVFKEAHALAAVGYQVEILGAWLDAELKARDLELLTNAPFRFTTVLDATVQRAAWFYSRLRGKLAREWHRRTGGETSWQLGYNTSALLRAARRREADLFIAHSEAGLFAVAQLEKLRTEMLKAEMDATSSGLRPPSPQSGEGKESGKRKYQIGVDMEDWFSEDLPPEARKSRPVRLLRRLEQELLRNAAHITCTSEAMSKALAREYGCRPPTVIYNAFPWADRQKLDGKFKDRKDLKVPSLHWYSQTLGPGRGLEDLFAALPLVKFPMEIHLRGHYNKAMEDWLWPLVPENWRKSIFVHPLVSNDELLSRIVEHDIGFAGEQKYCRSRDLTVTNKILHYLLGGLAVVASDTAGQREIASQADEAVQIYPSGDSTALAAGINEWLVSRVKLESAKSAGLRAAENIFCWEKQAPTLLDSVQAAF